MPMFRNLFLPSAHPTLTVGLEGTLQHFDLLKGGTKQWVAAKNSDPFRKPLSYIDYS
jgi:hypothetical protein